MRRELLALVGALSSMSTCSNLPALARDPGGMYAHSPFHDWFASVHEPDNPIASCCGEGDAFILMEYRPSEKRGFAFEGWTLPKQREDGSWISPVYVYIPDEKVVWDKVNPLGRGVVWLGGSEAGQQGTMVLCFVPGSGV